MAPDPGPIKVVIVYDPCCCVHIKNSGIERRFYDINRCLQALCQMPQLIKVSLRVNQAARVKNYGGVFGVNNIRGDYILPAFFPDLQAFSGPYF